MSGSAEQRINLTQNEVQILRGAMNVAEEIIETGGLDGTGSFPIVPGQLPIIRNLNEQLRRRSIGVEGAEAPSSIQTVFNAEESQAVRDVAGLLRTLLQDQGGREVLTEIGWLRDPDQRVNQDELDALMTVMDMLEPTGERPMSSLGAGLFDPSKSVTQLVDSNDPVLSSLSTAEDQISNEIPPWGGWEWAEDRLKDIRNIYSGGETDRDCRLIYLALLEVTLLAVGGVRNLETAPNRRVAGQFPVWVDEAYTAVMSSIETKFCLPDEHQMTLWDGIDQVINSLTPGAQQAIIDNGTLMVRLLEDNAEFVDGVETADMVLEDGEPESLQDLGIPSVVGGFRFTDDDVEDLQRRLEITRGKANALLETARPIVNEQFGDKSNRAVANNAASVAAEEVALPPNVSFTDARRAMREVIESALEGLTGTGSSAESDRAALQRIDRLRSELDEVLNLPFDDVDEVEKAIRAILPPSPTDCTGLLLSLAELTQIAAQVAAGGRWTPAGFVVDQQLKRRVDDARRFILARLRGDGCLDDDTIRGLRDSILTVTEPLEVDPDDVQTRAFAALSDVRDVFQDPRRG